jgi:glycosyltransferase involved in cell wall biosynthesis
MAMPVRRHSGEAGPLVTIVTATLNLVKTNRVQAFERCVESVKRQTYGHIEHVIVDGGSTDGTLELIASHGLTCQSERDSGIYDAFNKGLRRANGLYVTYLNSDDYYCTDEAVQRSVEALEAANADWCYAHAHLLTADRDLFFWEGTLSAIPYGELPCHQTVFVKKDVLEAVGGFDQNCAVMADNLVMMRLHVEGYKSAKVDVPLVVFTEGGASQAYRASYKDEFVAKFHALYGKTCDLSLEECGALYGGACFSSHTPEALFALGNKLRYAEWVAAFFEERNGSIQRRLSFSNLGRSQWICFFGLPVFRKKEVGRCSYLYLFGAIKVMKVKTAVRGTRHYFLFGFIPVVTVKYGRR